MNLREILNEDIIDLEVEGTTKDEVLHNMATLLLNNGMGSSISIPHGKSEAVKKIGICIGKTKNDIKWETAMTDSGFQDTRLIFLFCVSADTEFATNHMLLLSELAGKLGNEARVAKLAEAKTKEEVVNLILCDDSELDSSNVKSDEEIVDLDIDF